MEKTHFEQQRDALVGEIALSLEQVLQNMNKLNRNLEGVLAVGNEFGSVEALWSQFESVMGKEGPSEAKDESVVEAEQSSKEDGKESDGDGEAEDDTKGKQQ